jgi:hypothetical protein
MAEQVAVDWLASSNTQRVSEQQALAAPVQGSPAATQLASQY